MPEVSVFCPKCGRSVSAGPELNATASGDALLAAIAYVAIVPPILFLLIPATKRSRFVRFHSWQSLLFALATAIIGLVAKLLFLFFPILPGIGFLFAWLSAGVISIAVFVLWVVLVVKAAQGRGYELPVIGPLAAQLAE